MSTILYRSVEEATVLETVIEKSRFIAHVMPISDFEEGKAFVARIKAEYKDATHNVPAVIFGEKMEWKWASDDGEPQGTAGMPVLNAAASRGITNVAIVVTRYFGGVKLGTGGLTRAYGGIAKDALDQAGICDVKQSITVEVEVGYPYLSSIQNFCNQGVFKIEDIVYTDVVTLKISTDYDKDNELCSFLQELTSGSEKILRKESGKIKIRC